MNLAAVVVFVSAFAAEDDLRVLTSDSAVARKTVSTHLKQQAQALFDARAKAVASLKTADAITARSANLRAKFIEALGGFPERTPLQPVVIGREDLEKFSIERVVYQSRPGHHVTAALWIPKGKGPFPAVIFPCGHSSDGKASYQRACMLLAVNGIAAMSYDPIGQGERRQLVDQLGKPVIRSMTDEHTLVTIGAMPVGRCTASYRIWDGIRSLDYLASRPDIDPKNLGCSGVSGGGTLTSYLMALDDRIKAAAPSCYITSLERLYATLGPQDGEQNIPGQIAFGFDHADFLTLRAPQPTLVLAATRDFFDIQGTWNSFREAKRLYGLMGFPERLDIVEADSGHGYPKAHREAMARFMARWLQGRDEPIVEGELTAVPGARLLCTKSGQVLTEFAGLSVFDLNALRDRELAPVRAEAWSKGPREANLTAVRKLLALPAVAKATLAPVDGTVKREGCEIRKGVFTVEAGIPIPALFFEPEKPTGATWIWVNGDGKAVDAAVGGEIEKRVRTGTRVVAIDLRGMGETAAGASTPGKPGYFGVGWFDSFVSHNLGRPLTGRRVLDLLGVVEHLAGAGATDIRVRGVGTGALVVLHAAALDTRLREVEIVGGLVSWSAVVNSPVSYGHLGSIVFGALQSYDLPDLAGAIAPRPLTIASPVDAQGVALKPAAVEAAYFGAAAAYRAAGAADRLTLRPAL